LAGRLRPCAAYEANRQTDGWQEFEGFECFFHEV